MASPHVPVLQPPIGFAQGGARAHEDANTMPAFDLALRLGATGLDSDVWLTADGVPVLDAAGVVGRRPRRKTIASCLYSALPDHVATLDDLYRVLGVGFDLSLGVADPAVIPKALDAARRAEQESGAPAVSRLWLSHPDWESLAAWRGRFPDVHLVDSTRLHAMKYGPERRAAQLANAGIDAVSMPYDDWAGGLVILFRRFEVLSFGRAAEHDRMLDDLLRMGLDAVGSDHVDRMVDALARAGW